MPGYLYDPVLHLVPAFVDPTEPLPAYWSTQEPESYYYGTRAQQQARWRAHSAYRRARAAQDEWAERNGWTRRQVAGMRRPEWIAYGWADLPPGKA